MTSLTFTLPIATPIGRLVLESDGEVLIGIWLPSDSRIPLASEHAPPVLKDTANQLDEYFAGRRRAFVSR